MWSGYNDWEDENEDRLEENGRAYQELLKKEREQAEQEQSEEKENSNEETNAEA